MFAVVKAGHGSQHDDGGQSRQGPDTWVGDQPRGIGVGQGCRRNRVVKLTDVRVEAREQLEALIPASRGVRGQHEGLELRQARPAEELGATHEPIVQGDGVQAIFHHGADADEPHATQPDRGRSEGACCPVW